MEQYPIKSICLYQLPWNHRHGRRKSNRSGSCDLDAGSNRCIHGARLRLSHRRRQSKYIRGWGFYAGYPGNRNLLHGSRLKVYRRWGVDQPNKVVIADRAGQHPQIQNPDPGKYKNCNCLYTHDESEFSPGRPSVRQQRERVVFVVRGHVADPRGRHTNLDVPGFRKAAL